LLEMMQQRALLLQEAVDLAVIRYRQGESRYDVVLSLQRDLLDAELQLATNREQRIAVYRRLVDNMTTAEKVARQLYEAKEVSQIDYLRAKAARLQAQIDLEKAMRQ